MKLDHSNRAHAKLSASGAKQSAIPSLALILGGQFSHCFAPLALSFA
jgi:hypothetical protein